MLILALIFLIGQEAPWPIRDSNIRGELIISRDYRMPIYRTFQIIEENIVSNLQYPVFRYSQGQWFILSFFRRIFSENSENPPKIPRKSAENSPKIRRKFPKFWKLAENSSKRRSFLRPKYRIGIVSRKKAKYRIDIVSSQKKLIAQQGWATHWRPF